MGLAEMAAGWREFLTAWTGYGVRADEYRELGDGRVLVILHAVGCGKTSGMELGQTSEKGANLYDIGGGKVTRLVTSFDRENALVDLGLQE